MISLVLSREYARYGTLIKPFLISLDILNAGDLNFKLSVTFLETFINAFYIIREYFKYVHDFFSLLL